MEIKRIKVDVAEPEKSFFMSYTLSVLSKTDAYSTHNSMQFDYGSQGQEWAFRFQNIN